MTLIVAGSVFAAHNVSAFRKLYNFETYQGRLVVIPCCAVSCTVRDTAVSGSVSIVRRAHHFSVPTPGTPSPALNPKNDGPDS